MPTLLYHEIQSYRTELQQLQADAQKIAKPGAVKNLTHASFGVSNRRNLMVVGLCSLVEVHLFELAETNKSPFKISDIRGQGLNRLKLYLSRLQVVDFGSLRIWDHFLRVSTKVRNEIIHSYGGIIAEEASPQTR